MSTKLVRRLSNALYADSSWEELVEYVTAAAVGYTHGAVEQVEAKQERTGALLGQIIELLIEHNALPEQMVFDAIMSAGYLSTTRDAPFKLVPEE